MNAELHLVQRGWGADPFMTTWEEDELAGDIGNLDAQALAGVYDRYAEAVYKYVRYRVNDDRVAEDVASEVFLRLIEALRRGGGPHTNMKAWLLSTAGHIVTDHIRRSYRRPTEAIREEHPDPGELPGDEFDQRERTRNFRSAYRQLTAEQQHVLALRFGEGLSLEETAAVIQKKVNAVKALQFRAMQTLQRLIGELEHE